MSWRAFVAASWGAWVGALTFAARPVLSDHPAINNLQAVLTSPGLLAALTVGRLVPFTVARPEPAVGTNALMAGTNALLQFAICFFILRFIPAFRTRRIHLLVAAAIVVGTVCIVFLSIRGPLWAPAFPVPPLAEHPRVLTLDEVERTLQSDFLIIRTVQRVPSKVRQDYSKLTGESFDMQNPGGLMTADVIVPGVPNRRLVLVGLGRDCEVLIYEKGGIADSLNVLAVVHGIAGGAWGAQLPYDIHTISDVHEAVLNNRYSTWRTAKTGSHLFSFDGLH